HIPVDSDTASPSKPPLTWEDTVHEVWRQDSSQSSFRRWTVVGPHVDKASATRRDPQVSTRPVDEHGASHRTRVVPRHVTATGGPTHPAEHRDRRASASRARADPSP